MTLLEAYTFLFADCFMATLVLPLHGLLAYPVMVIFGTYTPALMVAIAVVSSSIAMIGNWGLGKLVFIATRYTPNGERAKKFVQFLTTKGAWLLLLSWIPVLGGVMLICLALVGMPLKRMLMIVPLAHIFYYVMML